MSYENPWYYRGEILDSDQIEPYVGFVYLIEDTVNLKSYVGKKFFWSTKTRSVKGKKKKVKCESDWKKYYGSNKTLQELTKTQSIDTFKRTVLHLCFTKTQCTYYEMEEQVKRDVLFSESYYNEFIGVKINGKHLKRLY